MKQIDRIVMMALAGAVLLTFTPAAEAQRVTGQISGTVKDGSGAVLPGVAVTLSGEKIMGNQTAVTTANGFYRFRALPPGEYDLSFVLDGFSTQNRSKVRVALGATTVEDVEMTVGDLTEAITVVGEAPVIDTESNEVGVNYGRDWVESAPVARSSFNDLVAAAPGSLRAGDTGFAGARTMVFGSSYDENSFQIDGADVNDNFFNEQLAELNVDTIEEIEVLSLGAPAEYGNLTGAVYNIVTRQGSNTFHGDINVFKQTDSLTESNTTAEQDGGFPFKRDDFTDYSIQIGGPLAQDRAWFFLSYQRQEDSSAAVGVDPVIGTDVDEFDRLFGKLNFQINPSHKIQISYNLDESVSEFAPSLNTSASTAELRTGKTPTPAIGYTGVLTDDTLLDVRFTGFYGDVSFGPRDPNQPRDLPRFYALDTGFISGGAYYFYELEPERSTLNAKVSHLADDFLGGSHDFRFGVQYNESSAGGLYGYNDLILTYGPGYTYGYGYTRVPFSYSGNTEAIGFFVDDTVRVNERLTLNLGVRYDDNRAFSEQQAELDENLQPTGVTFPEFEHYTWEYVSPRLGFNYQLTQDGRTLLKGHAGRYHRAIATGEFANVIGPSIKPIFGGFYDLETGTFDELFQLTDNANLMVDPDYKSPRTDQLILSLERQIGDNTALTVSLVNKRGRDFAAWRDTGGLYETVTWIDGDYDLDGVVDPGADPNATGNPIELLRLVGGDRFFVITNRSEMDNDIDAASISVNRRMANNWSLNGSITYLKSEGRTPDSLGGSSLQQRGGLQFRTFGRNPNDFVNSDGRLRGDVPLQAKAQFIYQLPKGFLVSSNFVYRDGANRVRRVNVPREVTNLSTRIPGQRRGTFGRLPSAMFLDARVQKDFDLKNDMSVAIFADIFNLLNDDAHQSELSSIGTSSSFGLPDGFVLPRRVQLGAKFRF